MTVVCLLVLCGLPGAGKTTFIRRFTSFLKTRSSDSAIPVTGITGTGINQATPALTLGYRFRVIDVSYDELMPAELEARLVRGCDTLETETRSKQWKAYRRSILQCIERLILKPLFSTTPSSSTPEFGLLNRHSNCELCFIQNTIESRATPLDLSNHSSQSHDVGCREGEAQVLQELLLRFDAMVLGGSEPRLDGSEPRVLVVIDDNMYYASMRYEVHQLSRHYGAGFAQLYFPVTVAEAMDRNSRREGPGRVSHDVIETMAQRIEPPRGTDVNPWEKNSTEIKVSSDGTNDLAEFEKVLALVTSAFINPVLPLGDSGKTAAEESRAACLASTVHCADTILRKLIGQRMTSLKGSAGKAELTETARRLNACRVDLLADIRSGQLTTPNTSSEHGTDLHTDSLILDNSSKNGPEHRTNSMQGTSPDTSSENGPERHTGSLLGAILDNSSNAEPLPVDPLNDSDIPGTSSRTEPTDSLNEVPCGPVKFPKVLNEFPDEGTIKDASGSGIGCSDSNKDIAFLAGTSSAKLTMFLDNELSRRTGLSSVD